MIRLRAVAVLAGLAAAVVAAAGCTNSSSPSGGSGGTSGGAGGPAAAPATWNPPQDVSAAAQLAGLPMLGKEELAVHYHAHLDVIVNGQQVTVPAGLGIDEVKQRISPLHTHDTTGVIHIESATNTAFTLGQVFTEWGQHLTRSRVGPIALGGDTVLHLYRDGAEVAGDPAALVFRPHLEIEVWVGPKSAKPQVVSGYNFPSGL